MALPVCLRVPTPINMIYNYYLTSQVADRCMMFYEYKLRVEVVYIELDLLYVCKQIYTEASGQVYDSNIFCFECLPQFDPFLAQSEWWR